MSDRYEVGYKKPPVAGRFQKGSTGNPNGRPRERMSPMALLKKTMNKKMTVREGNAPRVMTKLEAIFHVIVNKTLRGDAKATAQFLVLMKLFGSEISSEDEQQLCAILRVPQKFATAEEWEKSCIPLRDRFE